jgi:hypothetical protein
VSVFVLGLFVFIACILGWFSSITVFGFPIFLATFMKKSLKISDTLSIETSIFQDPLKVAQVNPLFKNKNYQLDKTNYRPVSVLPAISKLFERTIFDQLSSFFENHLITVFGFPIFLATFMKKSLKISDTFLGSFTMSLFSLKVIELFDFTPLLDKKAL